jgi:hypothetical protein
MEKMSSAKVSAKSAEARTTNGGVHLAGHRGAIAKTQPMTSVMIARSFSASCMSKLISAIPFRPKRLAY